MLKGAYLYTILILMKYFTWARWKRTSTIAIQAASWIEAPSFYRWSLVDGVTVIAEWLHSSTPPYRLELRWNRAAPRHRGNATPCICWQGHRMSGQSQKTGDKQPPMLHSFPPVAEYLWYAQVGRQWTQAHCSQAVAAHWMALDRRWNARSVALLVISALPHLVKRELSPNPSLQSQM